MATAEWCFQSDRTPVYAVVQYALVLNLLSIFQLRVVLNQFELLVIIKERAWNS